MASLESARSIIKSLLASGYEAYLVGGCVRDTLLGRTPKDYDIATSATPDIVKTIFGHVIPTGEKHGTVTVVSDDNYEVTTFRVESGYTDMRHPDKVEFVRNLTDDLARRDFTINAMAMDADGDIIDPFGGQEDLKKKLIRTVGLASDRFHEDPLRELRAVRFAAQLGFGIHKDTFLYLKATTMIENISKERIRDEIVKMLMSPGAAYGIQILRNTAMWDFIFPRFAAKFVNRFVMNPYHYLDIYMHSLQVLNYVSVKYSDPDIVLKIAAFLHDYGKPSSYEQDENGIDRFHGHAAQSVEEVREWMVDLRFDNATIDQVLKLIEYHDMFVEDYTGSAMKSSLTKLIRAFDKDFTLVEKWVALRMADISAQNVFYINERVQKLAIVSKMIMDLRKEDACIKVSDLKISGNDLKTIGYVEGPQIGNILKRMLDLVASDQLQNTKEILIEYAQKEKGNE